MDPLQTVVRILHIGSAIVLIGGATLWGVFIVPTLAQMGPTLPRGTLPTLGGKVVKILFHAGVGTLVFGLGTFFFVQSAGSELWRMLIMAALLLTLLMLVISAALIKPTFKKVSEGMTSGPPGPPSPETMAAMKKLTQVSMANLAIGWLTVLLMVVAVSVRAT